MLVDLVRDRVGVVAPAQLGDALELRPGQHPTGRIVRRAHDDRARARRERPRETVQVEWLARRERHVDRSGAAQNRVGAVVLVERLEHDHFVSRIDDCQHR